MLWFNIYFYISPCLFVLRLSAYALIQLLCPSTPPPFARRSNVLIYIGKFNSQNFINSWIKFTCILRQALPPTSTAWVGHHLECPFVGLVRYEVLMRRRDFTAGRALRLALIDLYPGRRRSIGHAPALVIVFVAQTVRFHVVFTQLCCRQSRFWIKCLNIQVNLIQELMKFWE